MNTERNYYAARSMMGVNFTFDSACWSVYEFSTKKERDTWVEDHEYSNGNRVSLVISAKTAYKIIGYKNSEYCPMEKWIEKDSSGSPLVLARLI